ncbi:hypothetical protein [Planctellipticum variicoloris]|uniref:hypothetical protein n=1 Tax=Planctellipticum variicoloris TaxID=3064265 RepID=UPI003013FAD0|nr:hypothetical protein SH412_004747 [Planctomycetaceae bacterium SH412]
MSKQSEDNVAQFRNDQSRTLTSPVTDEQLRPTSTLQRVQFSTPLTEKDHQRVAVFLESQPHVHFRLYGGYGWTPDLDFLRWYPRLKRFSVNELYHLRNFNGLQHLPDDVEVLGIGRTKGRDFSWRKLSRFDKLKCLYVEAQTKHIEATSQLTSVETLCLTSITLPGLELLTPLKRLQSLRLSLGGTSDLAALPALGSLSYLHLVMVRGLADLSMLARLPSLQSLYLQALKNVTVLPSFRGLKALRRVHLETMKGLTDLAPVAEAPNLEELIAIDLRQIPVENFRSFVGHWCLQGACIGLGSLKRNAEVRDLLGLPELNRYKEFEFR